MDTSSRTTTTTTTTTTTKTTRTTRTINTNTNIFNVGDAVLHKSNGKTIQAVIVEIRDIQESPYPIRIEYFMINDFGKSIQEFMWVLPDELIKVNDDEQLIYDYDDVDDE